MGDTLSKSDLRSYANVLTPANFKKILRKKDYYFEHYRSNGHIRGKDFSTCHEAINHFYESLLSNYKNEYVYKNILIHELLLKSYKLEDTIVLNEFRIGGSIADLVLLNGEAIVYEIKTEFDSLNRLDKQIQNYFQFADKVYVVSCSRYIPNLVKRYSDTNLGIIELTQRNALKKVKKASRNNSSFGHEVLFKTLRKKEYLDLIECYFGYIPNVPNTKIFRECFRLSKEIEIIRFQKMVINKIKKHRNISEPKYFQDGQIPDPLTYIYYNLNLSDKEFQVLDSFLKKQCIFHI